MPVKRAKDLDSLLRLHGWLVDEKRRDLGVLLARESELIAFGDSLDRQLLEEQAAATANPTTAGYLYAAYAQNNRLRKQQMLKVLAGIRQQITEAQDALAEAYRQLKVYEEVRKNRAEQERIEATRKEQADFDEIGANQFRRRMAEA